MAPNPKNFALSPASVDLGLGDVLSSQMSDELKKRKLEEQMRARQGAMSPATQSLLGQVGGFGGVNG